MGLGLLLPLLPLFLPELCSAQAFQGRPQVLPPPTLYLEPAFPVLLSQNVTYYCLGAHNSDKYFLLRVERGQPLPTVVLAVNPSWEGRMGSFMLPKVVENLAGLYCCMYMFSNYLSEFSNSIPLIVRAIPENPFLWVSPTSTPYIRQSMTFHCNSSLKLNSYYLYHGDTAEARPFIKPQNISKNEGLFYYREVHKSMLGPYLCLAYNSLRPYIWSNISNVLMITAGARPPSLAPWSHLVPVALTVAALGDQLA